MAITSAEPSWRAGDALGELEERLVRCVGAGELLDLLDTPRVEFDDMEGWGADRMVRAEVLRHLLVEAAWPVHAKGVRLRGVRIDGALDLESATLRCPLVLDTCRVGPVTLNFATASVVELTGCLVESFTAAGVNVGRKLSLSGSVFTEAGGAVRLEDADIGGPFLCRGAWLQGVDETGNALIADRVRVAGGLTLARTFAIRGAVRLQEAHIGGQLICQGAQIQGSDGEGNSLIADGIKSGDVYLNDRFTAAGAVRLAGAEIAGTLSCIEGALEGSDADGDAFIGHSLRVAGDAFFTDGFTAAGAVRLVGADIVGTLDFAAAKLTGTDGDGDALVADSVRVGGGVFLTHGFTAAGGVRFAGAHVTGQFVGRGAQLQGVDGEGDSLIADHMTLTGDAFLIDGFTAAGGIRFANAQISGSLYIRSVQLASTMALFALGLRAGHELHWLPGSPVEGRVNLERARVHRLVDDWSRPGADWPPAGRLRLDGFEYDAFGGPYEATWRQRLSWIRRSHIADADGSRSFAAQPYQRLALVYRQGGHEGEARQIAIARHADLRRYGGLRPMQWVFNWLLDKTINFGYRPLRAVNLLAAVYLAVLLLSWYGQHHEPAIVPTDAAAAGSTTAAVCRPGDGYPCFYPAGYAVDVVVPIVDLGQAEHWRVNEHIRRGGLWVAGTWVATGLGWAFSTLAVAGYTGLVRRE